MFVRAFISSALLGAWGGVLLKSEAKECAQLVGLLLLTVLGVYIMASPNTDKKIKSEHDKSPAVEIPAAVRRPYALYDLSKKKESFSAVCDVLVAEAVDELSTYQVQPSECDWIRKMLKFNVEGGKMNRGLMVVESGRLIFESLGIPVKNDDLCRFAVLGWCIEFLQAWLLVADDYMDSSVTRRGRPCWYRVEGVDKIAINDAFLIEMILFKIIKRHFGHLDCYPQLIDLMLETTLQTELGQLLDLRCEHVGLEDFTLERWTLIVKYKTAFYSFYLPVAMAMILAGISKREEYDAARNILVTMGIYFQAQDDFLDAFGKPEDIGKIGTDIQDKKCGWLFVNAYHSLCDQEQRQFLDEHYGKCKVGSAEEIRIKEIYAQVGLAQHYQDYEQASYDKIISLKDTVKILPWTVFEAFLHKIYKRQK